MGLQRVGHDWATELDLTGHPGCILSPYLTYMQSTSSEMPGWMTHKLESRFLGEISTTSDMQTCDSNVTWWNNGLVPDWETGTSRLYLSPCLFNLYAENIMWNAGLDETQAGIKNTMKNASDIQMTPPLWQKVKKNQRASWWKWKRWVKKLA